MPGWMAIYGWWYHHGLIAIAAGLIAMGIINP